MRVRKTPTKQDVENLKAELKSIRDRLAQVNTTIETKLQAKPVPEPKLP